MHWDLSLNKIIKKDLLRLDWPKNNLKKLEKYNVSSKQITSLIEELKFKITSLKTIEYLSIITILCSMILFFVTLHNGYNAALNEYTKINLSHIPSNSILKGAAKTANNGLMGESVIYYKKLLKNKNYYLLLIIIFISLTLYSTIYKIILKKDLSIFYIYKRRLDMNIRIKIK